MEVKCGFIIKISNFRGHLGSKKTKIIIAVGLIIITQPNILRTSAESSGTILELQSTRNISQVTQRKQKGLRSKSI